MSIKLFKLDDAAAHDIAIGRLTFVTERYVPAHNAQGEAAQLFGIPVATRRMSTINACAKKTSDRGVGRIPTECPDGTEKNGLICYPKCKDGYYGVGPVCWERCGSGETDTGAFCMVTPHTKSKNGRKCRKKLGVYWDPLCCFGGSCDPGYTNNGCTCGKGGGSKAKGTYGRGAGVPMVCNPKYDSQAGLCYDKCPPNSNAFLTMCLPKCPADLPKDCGVMCAKDAAGCVQMVADIISYGGAMAEAVAACIGAGVATGGLAAAGCAAAFVALAQSTIDTALGFGVC